MATVYNNSPLAFGTNTNIRLIELLPGPVWCDGRELEINCKFHVLPLTPKPRYTAISYMWGQDDATHDIVLDGTRFAVRPNLYQLLLTLSISKSYSRLLWVDAICINQSKIHERNHQVGLMGEIYSHSTEVMIWLGSVSETISDAIDRLHSGAWVPRDQLLALCRHPYWSRVWIVQEIFLANNVCIQSAQFRLENIDIFYHYIADVIKPNQSPKPDSEERSLRNFEIALIDSPAAKLLVMREIWQTSGSDRFLTPWDGKFGLMGCTDIRDRVYALSALMDPQLAITPDYNKSAVELFETIFEEHLSRFGNFSGPIWNLQSMLELDGKEPIVQRAKQHGSLEWLSTGIFTAYGRSMVSDDKDISLSALSAHEVSDDDALARMRLEWSEQTRRRRAAKERRMRVSNDGQ